jgi:ABC-2 type transport system ATP-binding protein
MIEVKELSKYYDDVEALSDVSFSIAAGEVIGLLGPNGAGKTTLMKILTGYLHPTSGTASVDGLDVLADIELVREMIGYLPENAPIYPELTVQSYLKMIADLRNIPKDQQIADISEAVHAVGLGSRLTRPIGTLSKGYRQRVGLAQAILHKPKLLILDEPTNGLDPTQIGEVRKLIKQMSQHSTILVSTHILSEVEATCDRAIIIINGKVKTDSCLADLSATSYARLTVARNSEEQAIQQQLAGIAGVKNVQMTATAGKVVYSIHGETGVNICPEIFTKAKEHDWPVWELRNDQKNLEAVFNELTAADGGAR